MRRVPKPTPNPPPPPEPPRAESGWHRFFRRAHLCGRTLWQCAALAFILLLGAWMIGLPGPLANRLLARLDLAPFELHVERLTFDPRLGLLLHDAELRSAEFGPAPLIQTRALALKPRFAPLLLGRFRLESAELREATLVAPPWTTPSEGYADDPLVVSNMQLRLAVDGRDIRLRELSGALAQVDVHAQGRWVLGPEGGPGWNARRVADTLRAVQRAPRALAEGVNLLNAMQGHARIRLIGSFDATPTGAVATARLEGGPFALHGAPFDHITASLQLERQTLTLTNARLRTATGLAELSASMDFATSNCAAQITCDLPPAHLRSLLFKPYRDALSTMAVESDGELDFHARVGPAPWGRLRPTFRADAAFSRLRIRGVPFADGAASLRGTDDGFEARDARTRFGAEGERGAGHGAFTWHSARRHLEGELHMEVDPTDLVPLLTSNQTRLVQRFTFPSTRPRFDGTFSVSPGRTNLHVAGRLAADGFTYRGVEVSAMTATLRFETNALTLAPWHFSRPEGVTDGSLTIDLKHNLIDVALDSTMNPVAIAGLVGPRLYAAVSHWRFDGPTQLRARGRIDATPGETRTDLVLDATGENMGRGRWVSETAQFTVHALGGSYTVTNLAGRAYGGAFAGQVAVEPLPAGPDHRYVVRATLTNAELAGITAHRLRGDEPPPSGRVSLDLQITGLVTDAFGPATRGSGTLAVEDGALFRLPLLGGLSDLLSRMVPGLGFAAQTDLTCSFIIADGAIFTDDLMLAGDVISMRADGEIEFDGRVDCRVEVQLLRRGPLAAILRFITLPVTKLLEFQLSGTLDEPKWRPVNLPKELFLIFD